MNITTPKIKTRSQRLYRGDGEVWGLVSLSGTVKR
jgi:hypothetical protein